MVKVTSKLGTIEVPHAHMWKDRRASILFQRKPLISRSTRIATIGSCFAAEIASAMTRLGLSGAMHPGGLFYTSRSIRQEMLRIFSGDRSMNNEPLWHTPKGYVHPFQDYKKGFATSAALREWTDDVDRRADELFRNADLYVITLGLIECWESPQTDLAYRQLPHPDVFGSLRTRMRRLTVSEIADDLAAMRSAIRSHSQAPIVVTVSPVPLHATFTKHDVRVANTESKSRIRAAVSEFVDGHDDVHYFHSYEIVSTAERADDFMLEDGRHVHRHAVDYILNEFLRMFAADDVEVPAVDTSWLTAPTKTAERNVRRGDAVVRPLRRAASLVWNGLPEPIRQTLRQSLAGTRGGQVARNGR
jgi:hypothetical protein